MWTQHKYANKLGYYWHQREDLLNQEKSKLHSKMVLNYYGYWGSKVGHISILYLLYKQGFFFIKTEKVFWRKMAIVSLVLIFSDMWVCKILNLNLIFELEELHDKYKSGIDTYRKKYQENKREKRIEKEMNLIELKNMGKNVHKAIYEDLERL
jgi:cell division protein FtsL